MGILNITPDSFYDGSAFFTPETAVGHALLMQAEGADILDIGAQSTRPGAVPVPPEEELRRLLPVLKALRGRVNIPISIDTFYPEVAKKAIEHGAVMVNDVSGTAAQAMAEIVKQSSAGWILMHNGGGTAEHVRQSLESMAGQAIAYGIAKEQLCVDPGIGFGPSREDDRRLLAHTAQLKISGIAYLVGASRKRVTGEDSPPPERLAGTIAAHTIAQLDGADILRVHDVKQASQAAKMTESVNKYKIAH